jgi:hypothetical protein
VGNWRNGGYLLEIAVCGLVIVGHDIFIYATHHNKQDMEAWKHGSINSICRQQIAIYLEANKFETYNITMIPVKTCTNFIIICA